MHKASLALLAVVLGSTAAVAQTAPSTKDFVQHAEITNALEIQAGHIAAQKGRTAAVKHFGQKMIHDHTQLEHKLDAALDKDKDTSLPKSTPLDATAQAQIQKFNSAKPKNFDAVYIDAMVAGHKKAVAAFQRYVKDGKDPVVREAAKKALPVLEGHLSLAEKIQHTENLPRVSSR